MVGKAQKSHGAISKLDGGCSNGVPPISVNASIATFQLRNADAPLTLLQHPKKSSFKTTVTPISRSGCSVVRSASLAKWGTSKTRPSPHLQKVPTRNNKVGTWSFQKALVSAAQNRAHYCIFVNAVVHLRFRKKVDRLSDHQLLKNNYTTWLPNAQWDSY
jgi:hypothetical protein